MSVVPEGERAETDSLTVSSKEKMELVTRAGKEFTKEYLEAAVELPKSPAEPTVTPRQPLDKSRQKELRYNKVLKKDIPESSSTPFRFDVLNQLANILARITLYKFLRLSRSTRESLREALANSEAFIAHVPAPKEQEGEECPPMLPNLKETGTMHYVHSGRYVRQEPEA